MEKWRFYIPKGHYIVSTNIYTSTKKPTDDYWGDYDYADAVYIGEEWKKSNYSTFDNSGPKCECGVLITYGDKCPPEYHSSYCPLYRKI